jgi:hypothetical protein
VHTNPGDEAAAAAWLREQLRDGMSLSDVRRRALVAWVALTADKPFAPPAEGAATPELAGRVVECALLDRGTRARVHYRGLEPAEMS